MAENTVARIAFFIWFFLITFSILLIVLILQKIVRLLLRRRLRRLIARDSEHDMVGRTAGVVRTLRRRSAGLIRVEYQGNVIDFKASSERKLRPDTLVRIISVTPEGFRVVPLIDEPADSPALADETDSTLSQTVVQDINVPLERDSADEGKP